MCLRIAFQLCIVWFHILNQCMCSNGPNATASICMSMLLLALHRLCVVCLRIRRLLNKGTKQQQTQPEKEETNHENQFGDCAGEIVCVCSCIIYSVADRDVGDLSSSTDDPVVWVMLLWRHISQSTDMSIWRERDDLNGIGRKRAARMDWSVHLPGIGSP